MTKLKPIEHKILKCLVESNTFLSTREVSIFSGVSWNTADNYLKSFHEKKWIMRRPVGKRTYWKAKV